MPPLHRQALNLIRALGRWIRHGRRVVDRATREKRLATCRGCELYRPESRRCSGCGCYLPLKSFLHDPEGCPLGKW